jgi:hypothetical protein
MGAPLGIDLRAFEEERLREIRRLGWPSFPFRAEIDYDMVMFPVEGWVRSAWLRTNGHPAGIPRYSLRADIDTDYDVPSEHGETRQITVRAEAVRPVNALDRFIEEVNRPNGNA